MPAFTGKRSVKNATAQGSQDKYTPGAYYAVITKGVYVVSTQYDGATYFGVETAVMHVIQSNTAEQNAPYPASPRVGQSASWVFNLNQRHQYLADGNIKNIAESIIDTVGFEAACGESFEVFNYIWEAYEEENSLPEAFCLENGIVDPEGNAATDPDPFSWVCDRLIEEGGEMFAGLPIRVQARDARKKGAAAANLFTACILSPVSQDEMEEFFGATAAV